MMHWLLSAAVVPLIYTDIAHGEDSIDSNASTFKVKLNKQHVPVVVNNVTVMYKTAYFGTVHVGLPSQNFTVVYDTGSGHFFLPSATCRDDTCQIHRSFNDTLSDSAVRVNFDGSQSEEEESDRDQVSISYGTGKIIGAFVYDVVCAGSAAGHIDLPPSWRQSGHRLGIRDHVVLPPNCAWVKTVLAKNMTTEPFHHFAFDGVLGLGLSALALKPEFHFFNQMTLGKTMAPVFGVFLAQDDSEQSEITFGGHDATKMSGSLQWVPVLSPEQGFWRIGIRSLRIGDEVVPFCEDGTCSAILDTGTSMLGAPADSIKSLIMLTARAAVPRVGTAGPTDCRQVPGEPFIFDVGDFFVELPAEDYTQPTVVEIPGNSTTASQAMCRASLLPVDMPALGPKIFLWGKPVLQRYYTAYDAQTKQVGLAPCSQPGRPGGQGEPSPLAEI